MKTRVYFFDIFNYAFLALICFATFYPFWNQLVISFATAEAYYSDWFHLYPRSFTLEAYAYNLSNPQVFRSFAISVFVTVSGTLLSMFLTTTAAYFLSKERVRGRTLFFSLFILTLFLNGGLIPTYMLVTRLGMRNSLLALIVPNALNVYHMVLMKNYFITMPPSLEESARLDGASELTVLARIVLPVSAPIIATISLFYSVAYWNDWFQGMIYLGNRKLYPLALYLQGLLSQKSSIELPTGADVGTPATVQAAIIMITIVPIICVYPFLQKHFVKGALVGAVKQ